MAAEEEAGGEEEPTQPDDGGRGRVPAALRARRHRHVVHVSRGEGQARSHQIPAHLEPPPTSTRQQGAEPRRRRRQTHVHRVAPGGSLPPHRQHLPVQHPGVRQVDEDLAVGPAQEQQAVGVGHRRDVGRLRGWGRSLFREERPQPQPRPSHRIPVTKLTTELSQQLRGGSPHVTMATRKL